MFEKLIEELKTQEISTQQFYSYLKSVEDEFSMEISVELLNFMGLPVVEDNEIVYLATNKTNYKDETYCVVDIETNANTPQKGQIIELGAIKYRSGQIIDKFESLVKCDFIPDYISKITNITEDDLVDAPSLKKVLYDFKLFLADSVFVAHNVNFDFKFISASLEQVGLPKLLNRKLCSIDLARKTIEAEKYGLQYLREHLDIDTEVHHRAYADAFSALTVLQESFKNIPDTINSSEDLIYFSKPTGKKRKNKN